MITNIEMHDHVFLMLCSACIVRKHSISLGDAAHVLVDHGNEKMPRKKSCSILNKKRPLIYMLRVI